LTEILFNFRHLYKFNTRDGSQLLWRWVAALAHVHSDTKKRELLKNPTQIEEIQEKQLIDRN